MPLTYAGCSVKGFETLLWQTVSRNLQVSIVATLQLKTVVSASSFVTPTDDPLRQARGVVLAIKMSLMFWAALATGTAGWLVR